MCFYSYLRPPVAYQFQSALKALFYCMNIYLHSKTDPETSTLIYTARVPILGFKGIYVCVGVCVCIYEIGLCVYGIVLNVSFCINGMLIVS